MELKTNASATQEKQKLADFSTVITTTKAEKSQWEYRWRKKAKDYRCYDTLTFLKDNNLSSNLIGELGCGDRGNDKPNTLDQNYVGIDISLNALKNARRAHPKANFVNADIKALPFRDGAFEVNLSYEVMDVIGLDFYSALKEIARINSGVFAFGLVERSAIPEDIASNQVKGQTHIAVELDYCLCMVPVEKEKPVLEKSALYFTKDSIKELLENAGFKKVVVFDKKIDGHKTFGIPMLEIFASKEQEQIRTQ